MRQLIRRNKLKNYNTNGIFWCCSYFIFFIALFCSSDALAKPKDHLIKNTATFREYLAQEKKHLTTAILETKKQIAPKNEKEYQFKTEQVSSILKMTRVKINSLSGFLEQQNKEERNLNQRLKIIQQLPVAKKGLTIQERVANVERLLAKNKLTTALINDDLLLATEFQAVLTEELKKIQFSHAIFTLDQKLYKINLKKNKLKHELTLRFQDNRITTHEKNPVAANAIDANYEAYLLINNQYIATIQYNLNVLAAQKMLVKADIVYLKNPDTKNLQFIAECYQDALNQYNALEKSLQNIELFLHNDFDSIKNTELKKSINLLQATVKESLTQIRLQKEICAKVLTDYQAQLKQLISSRQTLAEYSIGSWPIIVKKIMAIPGLFYDYIKTLTVKVYDSYLWLSPLSIAVLWSGLILIVGFFYILSRFFKIVRGHKERSRLAGYLYDGFLVIIQRNIPYICANVMLWFLFYSTNISFANYLLVLKLVAVWFIFRVAILIPRLVLLESISDVSGKDVKLYYRLKWLLLFGGWTTALMTIGHLLPLSLLLQDIFNRLFMLFILTVSIVAWNSKDVVRYLVYPLLKDKKRYVHNAISLLILLVPITLFTTAIIGLSGYINLAWTMSQYQANALTILVAYILVRGLFFDALELFSEWMISSLRNGWLWIEVFLKPLDKILRITLILFSSLILFKLYGWNSNSLVMVSLEKLAQHTIVNLPGIHITVASTIAFFSLLAIFIWAAKWIREFCYRWLFKNTKDAGIRNSLSVFSQYAVVLSGGFITLHVLGFDFSGMSMIIGGLAVGMGFGLRDFASNIVGGLMLLIERPVREGDLVTIGEHEGRVAHIGIRCMRVSSWDNMEVLIPNAETFNKPFTNWTHQDSIVRSVVPIKVGRSDDPVMIQQIILDVLDNTPEIVLDPPAQVFLKKIDTALIEFEARYFINVQLHSRFEVQSKVLFAITSEFKAANVKPPIEPISVEFKEGQGPHVIASKD